jgi:Cft2 family RNA processing exonuclease
MISPSGKKIMLTGDTSSQDQRSVPGVMLPKNGFFTGDFLGGDITMVAEGTNAARKKQKTREQIEKELVSFVEKVRRKNGSILFSCFGRQRAAELALTLIDLGYGVHIDGIARQMAAIEAPSLLNLAETGKVVFITGSRMETEVHRRRVAKGTVHCCGHEPPIIISPSASLEGGHSVGHATRILPFRNNGAGYVGHNFPDTPAYEIFHLRKRRVTLDVFGQSSRVDVNCRIGSFDLTAHDYQEDIIERVRLVEPKKLIVHHCPGFDEFHILHEEIIRNIPDPPKEIYYAPLVRKVEI